MVLLSFSYQDQGQRSNASSTTKADDYAGGLNPTVHNASSAVLRHLYSILKNKSDDGGCYSTANEELTVDEESTPKDASAADDPSAVDDPSAADDPSTANKPQNTNTQQPANDHQPMK